MLHDKTVAVVVPAYNEEKQIGKVIETMPDFVDRIIIVNDCSRDKTADVVREYQKKINGKGALIKIPNMLGKIEPTGYNEADIVSDQKALEEEKYYIPCKEICTHPETDKLVLIDQLENGGVGAAIARGYKWARDHRIDCTAVMAGDGQMDPAELESICNPVLLEGIDYVKGNRLIHRSSWFVIPKTRFFGNSVLSVLTKLASGYWHVSDTQTGYTAISLSALRSIRLYKIYRSYGMPNDMLVKLNIAFCTLREVEIKPVYRVGEQSKMKVFKVIPRVSWLLIRSFFKRLWVKYLFRDFHPLFLLYNLAFLLFTFAIPFGIEIFNNLIHKGAVTPNAVLIIFVFLVISGFQSFLFAMWMDIQDNDRLYK